MTRVEYWVATSLAAACFIVMATHAAFTLANETARADVTQRQQFVQQSLQLESLYRDIIRALAEMGVRNNDAELRGLLQQHGITVNVQPPATAAATPAVPARK